MQVIKTERANGHIRVQYNCEGKSLTEKAHKGSTNINNIIAKYKRTGFMDQRTVQPTYGDFTQASDYHDIKNRIVSADQDFMNLPAEIRYQFNNDPGELLDFLDDPENALEAAEMGLIEKTQDIPPDEPISPAEPIVEPVVEPVEGD